MFAIIFTEIDWKYLSWVKKWQSQKEAKNYSKSNFFLNKFENGQILRKGFDLMETTFFCQTSEMRQILSKTCFLLKMRNI